MVSTKKKRELRKGKEMNDRFQTRLAPAFEECVFVENDLRVSVLSSRILRLEKGAFTDLPSQTVVCRNFDKPQFSIRNTANKMLVVTRSCVFEIEKKTLKTKVQFIGSYTNESADNRKNLGGTARTLDGTFGVLGGWKGKIEFKDHFCLGHIRKGIFSANGVSELDDSKTFLICEDGSLSPREKGSKDKYVFAFGDDYLGGLKEFYSLTGYTPVLPKFALGNWWSRYHAYSDKEYLELMDEFEKKNIPLTVATIDMDWHIVKNVPKDAEYKSFQGAGWTGYTFEKSLFPDYKSFLKNLKDRGLAVTMNLHPRDGVRYFEEQYEDMARACGIDPATKQTVQFDLTDKAFLNAYFDILHHPYERDGVDFWWIDWQQGTKSKQKGLDPLWLLNHYHMLDNCRDGKHGLILSRYAGVGSHRYPLGFSGDTVVCWKSLKLQPYFTALASNVGYTWWSHDIGGHLLGRGDNELYLRWLQFGVFSPVNRLHSNNKSLSKEPWNYPQAESIAEDFLRLRHRLLPYLYSANVRTAKEGVPLISPLYYYSKDRQAYAKEYRNEYYFGEQMLVAPVTSKSKDGVANVKVWLPDGKWTDFFTQERFDGGKVCEINCPLDRMPVFVKDGAVIPLLEARDGNGTEFDGLDIKIYLGECEYTLFDENSSIKFAISKEQDGYDVEISVQGDCRTQRLNLYFAGVSQADASADGKRVEIDKLVGLDCKNMRLCVRNVKYKDGEQKSE